jgi:hypothetical protein
LRLPNSALDVVLVRVTYWTYRVEYELFIFLQGAGRNDGGAFVNQPFVFLVEIHLSFLLLFLLDRHRASMAYDVPDGGAVYLPRVAAERTPAAFRVIVTPLKKRIFVMCGTVPLAAWAYNHTQQLRASGSPQRTKEKPMRTFFGIALAVVIAATIWWTLPVKAKQQNHADTMNPLGMMTTTTGLPTDPEYDQGTVFLPPGVHYAQ